MARGWRRSLVLAAGAWLAVSGAVPGSAAAQPTAAQAARAEFVAGLRQSGAGGTLKLIERYYPDEARALVDRLFNQAASISNNFEDRSAAAETAMFQMAEKEMEALLSRKRKDIANAPAAQLLRVLDRQLAVLGRLETESPAMCSALIRSQAVNPADLTPAMLRLMNEGSEALMAAAGEGSLRPHDPGRLDIKDADAAAWMKQLEKLDPGGELKALIEDDAAMAAAAPLQQCRAARLILRAVQPLPQEQQANLMAFILGQSLEQ